MKVKNPVSQNLYLSWVNDHPYSIDCGYLLFFESPIMGNTADLAMVQKTIIDTLHKAVVTAVLSKRGSSFSANIIKNVHLFILKFCPTFLFKKML